MPTFLSVDSTAIVIIRHEHIYHVSLGQRHNKNRSSQTGIGNETRRDKRRKMLLGKKQHNQIKRFYRTLYPLQGVTKETQTEEMLGKNLKKKQQHTTPSPKGLVQEHL